MTNTRDEQSPLFETWERIPTGYSGHCLLRQDKSDIIDLWFLDGRLHNTDSPAFFNRSSKNEVWCMFGKHHRVGGPAVVQKYLQKWFFEGKRHRLDGPAYVHEDFIEYYIDDVVYMEEDYWKHPLVVEAKLNKILNGL